jgi:hypothetical protein
MKSMISRYVHIRFAYPAGFVERGHTNPDLVDHVDGVLVAVEDGFARIDVDVLHVRREADGKAFTEAVRHQCSLAHPTKYIASIVSSERAA